MWYMRGRFSGIVLIFAIGLLAIGEFAWGVAAMAIAAVIYLALGGNLKGFLIFAGISLLILVAFSMVGQ